MSAFYDDGEQLDAYELVERYWPYDGPYSDELTVAAVSVIERLGRYLNNATAKPDALPYPAVVGRVLVELLDAIAGYEQLLTQLSRFLIREADTDPSLYDDRSDRPGALTARAAAIALTTAVAAVGDLHKALREPAQLTNHLGSD